PEGVGAADDVVRASSRRRFPGLGRCVLVDDGDLAGGERQPCVVVAAVEEGFPWGFQGDGDVSVAVVQEKQAAVFVAGSPDGFDPRLFDRGPDVFGGTCIAQEPGEACLVEPRAEVGDLSSAVPVACDRGHAYKLTRGIAG